MQDRESLELWLSTDEDLYLGPADRTDLGLGGTELLYSPRECGCVHGALLVLLGESDRCLTSFEVLHVAWYGLSNLERNRFEINNYWAIEKIKLKKS